MARLWLLELLYDADNFVCSKKGSGRLLSVALGGPGSLWFLPKIHDISSSLYLYLQSRIPDSPAPEDQAAFFCGQNPFALWLCLQFTRYRQPSICDYNTTDQDRPLYVPTLPGVQAALCLCLQSQSPLSCHIMIN